MIKAIEIHRDLLEKWRKAMDLVGPGPIDGHFKDALMAVKNLKPTGHWADLGSGAGFPGIALAAYWPNIQVTLIESRHKRSVFLRQVADKAALKNVNIIQGRTEDIPGPYDGVISRAYKPPLEYLKDARRLLVPNGHAVLMLGSEASPTLPKEWTPIQKKHYGKGEWQRQIWTLRYDA